MLRGLILVALCGFCYASIFENGLKKLAPLRNEVQHFAMNIPEEARNKVESKFGTQAQELLGKLRGSLLLRGAPLTSLRSHPVLPLPGLQAKPSDQPVSSSRRPVHLESFTINNCSKEAGDKAIFVIRKLVVTPDPEIMPGNITFVFDINVKETLNNLTVALDMSRKVNEQFIHMPCLGGFGSCDYNVCDMLSQNVPEGACPQELVDDDINCQCPFKKNVYDVPGISAEIQVPVFLYGDYKVIANMTSGSKAVGCYAATFSIGG